MLSAFARAGRDHSVQFEGIPEVLLGRQPQMSSSSNYEGGKYAKKARKQADPSNAPVPETNLGASAPVKEASSPPQVAEEAHVSPVGEAGASVPAPGPSDPPPPTATVAGGPRCCSRAVPALGTQRPFQAQLTLCTAPLQTQPMRSTH